MRYIRIVVWLPGILLACTHVLANESVRRPSGYPAIGTLRDQNFQSLPYMCECEFFRGPVNGATTVFATRMERGVAFVMVDGHLVTLQRDGKPNQASCRTNARHHERWVRGPTAVVLNYHAAGSGEEACWFEGKMTVAVGSRTTSTGISGACGC